MRVYVPATATQLRSLAAGEPLPGEATAFAVTPGLREWYVDEDIEELEYAALLEAARASLRLLDGNPSAPPRRVVIAIDAPDSSVEVRDDLDRGVVRLRDPVPMADVASVHVDDPEASAAVAAAVAAIIAADLGDPVAQDTVDDADGFELSWYASQEIAALLDSL
jgi:hypothetical protein